MNGNPTPTVLASASVWRVAVPYYGAFLVLGLSAGFIGPALDELGARAGVSDGTIGLVFVAQGVAYLAGALGAGRLFDGGDGHRLLTVALLCVAASFACLSAARPLWAVLTVFLAIGFATAALDVGGNTLLVWSVPGERLVGLLNGLHLCFGLGALLSPAVVAVSLATSDSIAPACLVVAAIALCGAASLRGHPSPVRRVRADVRGGGGRPPIASLVAICSFFALYVGVEAGFVGWVYTFAVDSGATGDTGAALVVVMFWAGFCLARVLAATVGGRVSPGVTLATTTVAALVPALLIMVAGDHAPVLWAASAVLGFALGPQFALMIAYAERHLSLSGGITALFVAAASVGGLSIPWLIGVAMDRRGYEALPQIVTLGAVLVVTSLVAVRATTRRRG